MISTRLCNIALSRIGVSNSIADPDERSAEARVCRIVYEETLRMVLSLFPWRDLTCSVRLSLLDLEDERFRFVYAKPVKAWRVNSVRCFSEDEQGNRFFEEVDFRIGFLGGRSVILCDRSPVVADVIMEVEDAESLPWMLQDVFVNALAMNLIVPLTGGRFKEKESFAGFFQSSLALAIQNDANQYSYDDSEEVRRKFSRYERARL